MKQFAFAVVLLFWLFAGCGKIGDPHAPSIRVPAKIENLTASQNQDQITLSWTNPAINIDGTKVDDLADVQISEGGKVIHTVEAAGSGKPQTFPFGISSELNTSRIYTVSVTTRRGKTSAPSNAATIMIVGFPGMVSMLAGVMDQRRIQLTWKPPERNPELADVYVVSRQDGGMKPQPVFETHFADDSVEVGKTYSYTVTAGHGKSSPVFGPPSLAVVVPAVDTVRPGRPTGVQVVVSDAGAIIRWESNTETDLAGYFIYRIEGPGNMVLLNSEVSRSTSIRDPQFKPGFKYAIEAVDLDGNKSPLSESTN